MLQNSPCPVSGIFQLVEVLKPAAQFDSRIIQMLLPQKNKIAIQGVRLYFVRLYQTPDFLISVRQFGDSLRRNGLRFQLRDFVPLFPHQFPRRVLSLLRGLLLARRLTRPAKVDVAEQFDLHFQLDFRHAPAGFVIVLQVLQAVAEIQRALFRQLSRRGQKVRVHFRLSMRLAPRPRRFKLPQRIWSHVPPDNHEKEVAFANGLVNFALRPVRENLVRHILRVVPFQPDASRLIELVQRPKILDKLFALVLELHNGRRDKNRNVPHALAASLRRFSTRPVYGKRRAVSRRKGPPSVSSCCRIFGSGRAEGIEKRDNFAGTGGKRDGLSGVGQAGRKRNGFSFFGLSRFF